MPRSLSGSFQSKPSARKQFLNCIVCVSLTHIDSYRKFVIPRLNIRMNFKESDMLNCEQSQANCGAKCAHKVTTMSTKNRVIKLRSPARGYPLLVLLFFSIASQGVTAVHYSSPVPCGGEEQRRVMAYAEESICNIRETVVDLKPFVANLTDVIHVVPDVAVVMRCGGNCRRPSHRCIPISKTTKQIPIMMITPRFPHGNHNSVCGHIDIEEHVECGCDCPIRPEDCHRARIGDPTSQHVPEKYFDAGSCRCLCRNTDRRHTCISRGMEWDDSTCRCRCPLSRWQHCSTGYVFDYEDSCRCVPTSMTASLGLIAALIVLIVCILVTAVGFLTMYRRQTGLFRQSRRERIVRESQLLKKNESNDQQQQQSTDSKKSSKSAKQNLMKYDLVLTKETSADKK